MKLSFRYLGWAEGLSLLLLLGIAMPLKYVGGMPGPTSIVGAIHGLLFLLYNSFAVSLGNEEGWPKEKLLAAFLLSGIPFGTFIFERKFLRSETRQEEENV